jgi:ribosomal protein L11 methyltransferase
VPLHRVDISVQKGIEESLSPEFYTRCGGVWIEEAGDQVRIKCYPPDAADFIHFLRQSMPFLKEVTVVEEEEKDYVSLVRSHFTPVHVGEVTILPPWRKTKKSGKTIVIEPGMAFGTGRHESTRLMIKMMSQLDLAGKKVLDVGTGSGILALYACMSGADVVAIDHDPIAAEAAKKGGDLNECKMVIACSGAEAVRGKFDVVLANLDFDTFVRHGSDVIDRVNEGSYLVVSGIEQQYEKRVASLFMSLTMIHKTKMRDWRGYVFRRDNKDSSV